MEQMNLSTKQKQTHRESRLAIAKEEGGKGTDLEFGVGVSSIARLVLVAEC